MLPTPSPRAQRRSPPSAPHHAPAVPPAAATCRRVDIEGGGWQWLAILDGDPAARGVVAIDVLWGGGCSDLRQASLPLHGHLPYPIVRKKAFVVVE
eukprot:CAMPEP_0181209496 /NCGR_PEP_ID=MMETSP1096-20121128/22701_1 /TAXON_ID=156174 ORGANISM="Chrysochromulina ericina, Strain CCMP281" /NCGR_SAMPLE_ID=MMETSP1096 /ASSEMBLY_ACC=CAM_ASM_000453 /LENGTH=95 /DNA_ID=CAMNT_0023300669 /DNA_START=420 /DNA_END=707 /DNA_ORIENTATION=+